MEEYITLILSIGISSTLLVGLGSFMGWLVTERIWQKRANNILNNYVGARMPQTEEQLQALVKNKENVFVPAEIYMSLIKQRKDDGDTTKRNGAVGTEDRDTATS